MNAAQVFWFTGLSGAGKTTLAEAAAVLLEREGFSVLQLDGDQIRRQLHQGLGFSKDDIKKNNELIVELCIAQRDAYDAIFVPIISPFRESRALARARLIPGFHEIYANADLRCVVERDVKGLYAKAARGLIKDMIGYAPDCPYEPPLAPEFIVKTGNQPVGDCVESLYRYVRRQLGEPFRA